MHNIWKCFAYIVDFGWICIHSWGCKSSKSWRDCSRNLSNLLWGCFFSPLNTYISVSLNSGTNLLWTRGDSELSLALQAFIQSLFGQGGGATHVLVAGVGTAANQTYNGRTTRLTALVRWMNPDDAHLSSSTTYQRETKTLSISSHQLWPPMASRSF